MRRRDVNKLGIRYTLRRNLDVQSLIVDQGRMDDSARIEQGAAGRRIARFLEQGHVARIEQKPRQLIETTLRAADDHDLLRRADSAARQLHVLRDRFPKRRITEDVAVIELRQAQRAERRCASCAQVRMGNRSSAGTPSRNGRAPGASRCAASGTYIRRAPRFESGRCRPLGNTRGRCATLSSGQLARDKSSGTAAGLEISLGDQLFVCKQRRGSRHCQIRGKGTRGLQASTWRKRAVEDGAADRGVDLVLKGVGPGRVNRHQQVGRGACSGGLIAGPGSHLEASRDEREERG